MALGIYRKIADKAKTLWEGIKKYLPQVYAMASQAFDTAAPLLSTIPQLSGIVPTIAAGKNLFEKAFDINTTGDLTDKSDIEDDVSPFIKFKKNA